MGFVKFASDYEADQKDMQATADGLQNIVLTSPNVGPDIAAPWADFYKQLTAFDATPVYDIWRPFLPDPHFIATSGLADSFATQATQLNQWAVTINKAAGTSVPSNLDPTGQVQPQTVANIATVVKWGAIGLLAVAGAYVVKTAADIVKR